MEILPKAMEWAVRVFMEERFKIRTSNCLTNHFVYQWQTADQTQTEVNFSSQLLKQAGLMESMLYLEK